MIGAVSHLFTFGWRARALAAEAELSRIRRVRSEAAIRGHAGRKARQAAKEPELPLSPSEEGRIDDRP